MSLTKTISQQKKWKTLKHNGVLFPSEYKPHGVKLKYNGKPVLLTTEQEEMATMYANLLGTTWTKKALFKKNFFNDFQKILCDKKQKKKHPYIKELSKCDFKSIQKWCKKNKEVMKELRKTPGYKSEAEKNSARYSYALVDGKKEKISNFRVEPPGLFLGRGEHPKMGSFKKRIRPEDITINVSKGTTVKCPIKGRKWGRVINEPRVAYIAKWIENINNNQKCVYLGASSSLETKNDKQKFEKARELKKNISKIRKDYNNKMKSSNVEERQLGTITWLLDNLCIRIGNSKNTKKEADTVGLCSLRCEHIKMGGGKITLDFLGKDSMRYLKTISVPSTVYKNLSSFCKKKTRKNRIFDKISSSDVNEYLRSQMKGLTAKVFRTYNASITMEKELLKKSKIYNKEFYNNCNKQVALLCNHQKNGKNKGEVSLGTSKINYMDPRITIAWCKRKNVPLSDVFNKTLIEKFEWASKTPKTFRF